MEKGAQKGRRSWELGEQLASGKWRLARVLAGVAQVLRSSPTYVKPGSVFFFGWNYPVNEMQKRLLVNKSRYPFFAS